MIILRKYILYIYIVQIALYFSVFESNLFEYSYCYAETVEENYNIATQCYKNLKKNPELQKYRHNWLKCIKKFALVYSDQPNHSLASSAMYRSAELYFDLYKISAIDKDKLEAVDLLNRIIKRYSSSTDKEMAEKLLSSMESCKNEIKNEDKRIAASNQYSQKTNNSKNSNINSHSDTTSKYAYITDLRYWTTPDYTRIVINISEERRYVYQLLDENISMDQPKRLYLDIKNSLIGKNLPAHTRINDDLLLQARAGQRTDDTVRVVVDIKSFDSYKVFSMSDPFRVIIDVWGDKKESNSNIKSGLNNDSTLSSDNSAESSIKKSIKKSTKIYPSSSSSSSSSSAAASASAAAAASAATPPQQQPSIVSQDSQNIDNSSESTITLKEHSEINSETTSEETSHLPVKKSLKKATMVLSDATRKLLRETLTNNLEESSKNDINTHKKALKQSTKEPINVVSPLKKDKNESKESKENSKTAIKGTTRVVQIAPGSNVDRIKASSIAKQLALGVRTIVIDPGHGGRDPGASGYTKGIYEKNVVLAISKKLANKIKARLNCNVILTRSSDTYLTLEERTAIANTKSADLFISLHCNASNDSSLVGIETYYLNLATDERAINVAARENATSRKNISDLESILNDLMKNAKINESSRLSSVVQSNLYRGMAKKYSKVKNLGVKQAPFYVLLGASMPSILIETSFLSNPEECRRLTDSAYQNALCDSITDGIAKYIRETNPQRL